MIVNKEEHGNDEEINDNDIYVCDDLNSVLDLINTFKEEEKRIILEKLDDVESKWLYLILQEEKEEKLNYVILGKTNLEPFLILSANQDNLCTYLEEITGVPYEIHKNNFNEGQEIG